MRKVKKEHQEDQEESVRLEISVCMCVLVVFTHLKFEGEMIPPSVAPPAFSTLTQSNWAKDHIAAS